MSHAAFDHADPKNYTIQIQKDDFSHILKIKKYALITKDAEGEDTRMADISYRADRLAIDYYPQGAELAASSVRQSHPEFSFRRVYAEYQPNAEQNFELIKLGVTTHNGLHSFDPKDANSNHEYTSFLKDDIDACYALDQFFKSPEIQSSLNDKTVKPASFNHPVSCIQQGMDQVAALIKRTDHAKGYSVENRWERKDVISPKYISGARAFYHFALDEKQYKFLKAQTSVDETGENLKIFYVYPDFRGTHETIGQCLHLAHDPAEQAEGKPFRARFSGVSGTLDQDIRMERHDCIEKDLMFLEDARVIAWLTEKGHDAHRARFAETLRQVQAMPAAEAEATYRDYMSNKRAGADANVKYSFPGTFGYKY